MEQPAISLAQAAERAENLARKKTLIEKDLETCERELEEATRALENFIAKVKGTQPRERRPPPEDGILRGVCAKTRELITDFPLESVFSREDMIKTTAGWMNVAEPSEKFRHNVQQTVYAMARQGKLVKLPDGRFKRVDPKALLKNPLKVPLAAVAVANKK